MARWGALSLAILAMAACLGLAVQHPLVAPPWAVAMSLGVVAWSAWRPWTTGWLLMALLPVASLVPVTGWWLVDEFDLLVLGVLAGLYGRLGWDALSAPTEVARVPGERMGPWLWTAVGLSSLVSLAIGLHDAGGGSGFSGDAWRQALYGDYDSIFNAVRVSKSVLWVLLLTPALSHAPWAHRRDMVRLSLHGLACGLALVCVLVLWERWRYVGVFNFVDSYRTVASFWEMHVGGGAIDAYLAMAVPVAFWMVWSAPSGWRWVCAALLALLSTYAVLTTYSRGLYLAVAVALIGMAVLAHRFRLGPPTGARGRPWALKGLALVLLVQAVWVLGGHTFMSGRMARVDVDLVDRVAHWRDGVGLLRSPSEWMFGLGSGRLPAHYSAEVPGGEFPGRAQWQRDASGAAHVKLSGPGSRQDMAYDFGLAQRVDIAPAGNYRVRIRYETDAPLVLLLSVCERHLLYDFRCQWKHMRPEVAISDPAQWHDIPLPGKAFAPVGHAVAWRDGLFSMTVLTTGQTARIHEVQLLDPQGHQVLENTGFTRGLEHWFRSAQGNFKPWHMDNLYLEILIERGLAGWLVLGALGVWAGCLAARALKRGEPLALALTGSLLSMGVLGMVISVTELPRVAFMLLFILLTTSQLRQLSDHQSV